MPKLLLGLQHVTCTLHAALGSSIRIGFDVILVLYNDIVSQGRRKIGEIVRTDDYTIDPFIFQPLSASLETQIPFGIEGDSRGN